MEENIKLTVLGVNWLSSMWIRTLRFRSGFIPFEGKMFFTSNDRDENLKGSAHKLSITKAVTISKKVWPGGSH